MESVKVSTITYNAFVKKYSNIVIPDFQRPYRWGKQKIEELLADLKAFFISQNTQNLDYYMGSILLYRADTANSYQVIDGQQRLTTLNLIYYIINNELLEGQNFEYNNHLSVEHIKQNKTFLDTQKALLTELQDMDFFDKLSFTLIETKSEDHAFAFFDSQNNRGVSLATEDYLKAYHLRAIASENTQAILATQWEKAAVKAQNEGSKEKGLGHLFDAILYRAREWKGQNEILAPNRVRLLQTFQKNTIKTGTNEYPLFPNKSNQRFASVRITENGEFEPVDNKNSLDLKRLFSLRQPIYEGSNFFQYTQQYYDILQTLLYSDTNTVSPEIAKVSHFYHTIYTKNMSEYLRTYMQLCLVLYYDTFGEVELYKAVQYFDYFIGHIRILKYYVRQESIKNSLKQQRNNLLDIIANAYFPAEVFEFISSAEVVAKTYAEEALKKDDGVKSNYKKRLIDYYFDQSTKQEKNKKSLKARLSWIK